VLADLHDERTNKRLLTKGALLDRETIERISTKNLKRIRYNDKDPRVNEQIDEIEEMTSRQIEVLRRSPTKDPQAGRRGRTPSRRHQAGQGLRSMKRKLFGGDKMAVVTATRALLPDIAGRKCRFQMEPCGDVLNRLAFLRV